MCIGLFNFLLPPSVSGRRNLSCLSRPKVNVRGCTVSLRKPRPCGDPGEPLRALGKSRRKQKLPAPLSCVDPTVYLFIYLVAFFLLLFFFLLRLLLSCMWSIFHYLISASQKKKKKVCEALHKRGRLNTQLCSAQLRWHWTPAALFKSGLADSRANRTWQLIMWKWMRWRRRNSSAIEG